MDRLEQIKKLSQQINRAEKRTRALGAERAQLMREENEAGASWEKIATAAGLSRMGAHKAANRSTENVGLSMSETARRARSAE